MNSFSFTWLTSSVMSNESVKLTCNEAELEEIDARISVTKSY